MLYIFLFILLIIILLIVLLILTKKKEHLKNIDKYHNYQLGDVIKGWMYKTSKGLYNSYPTKFPDTLATKYINEVKNLPKNKKWNNMKVLDKLTKRPNKLDVALHLRMGDVICKYDKKTNTFNTSCGSAGSKSHESYFHQPSIYEKLFKQLKQQQNIKQIHLFYGAHTVWNEDNDKYLEIIKKIINSNGFKIIDNSNGNPDSDFINMSNSKIFIRSGQGGGFSNSISNLVKYRNNKVINPSDYK